MIFLLDPNILIYLIKNHPPQVAEGIDALAPHDSFAMSFITWAALLQLDLLNRQVPVLVPEGANICRHYAVQATALKRRGIPIGANDLWNACHALPFNAIRLQGVVGDPPGSPCTTTRSARCWCTRIRCSPRWLRISRAQIPDQPPLNSELAAA